MNEPVVELCGVSKYFAKVIANRRVSFTIGKGEVVALLGENGAGKSTIMKVLYGLYHADEGEILIDGQRCEIHSPKDASALGIGMIQQHFSLIPAHTVMENIILGNEKGMLDRKGSSKRIRELSGRYGFSVDPDSLIRDLPVGVQQKVEILKTLYQEARILIMDEPTAVLTPQEAQKLMDFIRDFAAKGNSVVFISHKLQEVMQVADRIVVMRSGEVYGDVKKTETSEKELSRLMVGRDIPIVSKSAQHITEADHLELKDVTVIGKNGTPVLEDISFSVGKGEIFGIAGVSGNGQQELGETISGLYQNSSGSISVGGKDISRMSVLERIDLGIGYVHADRHAAGLVLDMSVAENMLLKSSFDPAWSSRGIIRRKRLEEYALKAVNDYSVKTSGIEQHMKGLSGGNQQKVVLAREVEIGSNLIIFDQPTRGLDLGAIEYVHRTILAEREKGKCILLISAELSELFALSDRIGVMYEGRLLKTLPTEEATVAHLGLLMAGVDDTSREEAHE